MVDYYTKKARANCYRAGLCAACSLLPLIGFAYCLLISYAYTGIVCVMLAVLLWFAAINFLLNAENYKQRATYYKL
ncbi:hypothetical protein JIN85_14840 [Luteolibacter pohnpeiensis]|uniref:Uncharacterized protein n=2 Tax=Luteolibacter pohnpeiensis TaxID=454153 RepID=A0A934SCM8_9BACT|nr:hypothetical protein [Luteolibacter pohnpeiensis]